MSNKKTFNSKNIATIIQNLLANGKVDLSLQILKTKELKNLLPRVIDILKRKSEKQEDYNSTKIYSKTSLSSATLQDLEKFANVDISGAKIIIDKDMSPGVRVKSGNTLIDATLSTMLQKSIEKILAK